VSNASLEDLVAMGIPRNSLTVVRNGVASRPVATTKSTSPRLCVLARLVPHKQVEHALAVVARLSSDLPDVHLDVVGEGWWHEQLEAEVRQLGIEGRVTFHGHVDDAERDRVLAESWLMLLPSVKEGWGLAVLEAAVQGTPTVAYRYAGGVTESVVDLETGLLADDPAELFALTRLLMLDEGTRNLLGRRAAERAMTFAWSGTTDAVERVLSEAQDWSP
jgi:glycosyltransferase involved in cell wall biosynthesis